jgi:hypothetical protein
MAFRLLVGYVKRLSQKISNVTIGKPHCLRISPTIGQFWRNIYLNSRENSCLPGKRLLLLEFETISIRS